MLGKCRAFPSTMAFLEDVIEICLENTGKELWKERVRVDKTVL